MEILDLCPIKWHKLDVITLIEEDYKNVRELMATHGYESEEIQRKELRSMLRKIRLKILNEEPLETEKQENSQHDCNEEKQKHKETYIISIEKIGKNMGDNNDDKLLRGLFEGGNFPNSQINILTGDNPQVSYESPNKRSQDEKFEGLKQSVIDYVTKLMPVVAAEYKEEYQKMWVEILEKDAVSKIVYERGRQQRTLFNRNLVAQISHMMLTDGIIINGTTPVRMAELLEPEKGKDHPVRGALGMPPEDKQVKKAVNEVFEKHGVKAK